MSYVSVENIAVCMPIYILSSFLLTEAHYYYYFYPLQGHELKDGDPISSLRNEPWLVQSDQLGLVPFGSGYFIYCRVTKSWSMKPKENSTGKLLWEIFLTIRVMHRNVFSLLPWIICLHMILVPLQPFCHHEERHTVKERNIVFISCHCKRQKQRLNRI